MGMCCTKKNSFQWAPALPPPKASGPHRSLSPMGWATGLQPGPQDQSTAAIAVLHANLQTEVIVRCNFCVPYSKALHCSAASLPVSQPLLLPSYFPQPPSINGDMGSLKCPEGSAFGQIQLSSFAVVASMKNATFFSANSWNKFNWIYTKTGFVSELVTRVLVYFWLNIIPVNGIHIFSYLIVMAEGI